MQSKNISSIVALLFGSTGAHRFYLGQNRLGWYFLLFFFVLFPAAIWYSKTMHVSNYYMLTTIWIALIILTQITEAIRYGIMSKEKFKAENRSTGATFPLTITAIVFAFAAIYGFKYLMAISGQVDIETAKADFQISSAVLSDAYNTDEDSYMQKYDGKVLEVSGKVLSFGEDFEKGTYLALQPAEGSPADVNCYIHANYTQQLAGISAGDSVIIKGVCNRRFLNNCKILNIIKN